MSYLPSNPEKTLIDVFKDNPAISQPLHEFAEVLMRGDSPFSPGERELIAVYVSHLNHCAFCYRAHLGAATRFGVDAGAVDTLLEAGIDEAAVDERLKPVLRYVRKLNDAPGDINQADVDAVLSAGWDEQALCHAALVCGFFNLMNRWVDGLGLRAEPRAVETAGRMLHERGYAFIADMLRAKER